MESIPANAKFRVNDRRVQALTVRWSREYLTSRILLILSQTTVAVPASVVLHAVTLLEHPAALRTYAGQTGLALPDNAFPPYVVDSLAIPSTKQMPEHETALAFAISTGLVTVNSGKRQIMLELSQPGRELATRVIAELDPSYVLRARLSLRTARKSL